MCWRERIGSSNNFRFSILDFGLKARRTNQWTRILRSLFPTIANRQSKTCTELCRSIQNGWGFRLSLSRSWLLGR